ncbi:hypothetical protein [Amycolatopsis anabasis]|uniref:hypothetical protein n=1 Tax=Amycolatopsis anabasis TaxID=1840409 RepID=UPI00131D414E|nr:hypothetical protein [Amycolatopsis anabasis]
MVTAGALTRHAEAVSDVDEPDPASAFQRPTIQQRLGVRVIVRFHLELPVDQAALLSVVRLGIVERAVLVE